MQFDIDIRGEFSDIFMRVRDIVLSFDGIREQKNPKQTAYYDEYSAVCFLRCSDEKLTIALAKGACLKERYPFLKGDAKIVRHIYIKEIAEVDEELLREIIKESMILNLESYELKKLKGK